MRAAIVVLAALIAGVAQAQPAPPGENEAKPGPAHYGLLRARDLTPFGFLRLDMRPTHAVSAPPGTWGVEVELDYQNTWAMSENVRDYLNSFPGRRGLGQAEVQAIQNLPGEKYLVDMELGLLGVTFHRSLVNNWSAYATVSLVDYSGGFMDGGIEQFHKTFGIPDAARPKVERDAFNVIYGLKGGTQVSQPDAPEGGLLDPVFGVRYAFVRGPAPWNLVVESAVKVPLGGERPFLSTGHTDVGAQATLQHFAGRHASYASLAVVYAKVSTVVVSAGTQVVPTAIVGYEYAWTGRTNLNVQLYASPSVFKHTDTDLNELLRPKFQFSIGVRHRIGASVLTFAVTENLVNFNNSPDIGFQLGWAYSPAFMR